MHDDGLLSKTLKKAVKHSMIYGVGMSFTAISGILLVPLYTRFLSPADYGVYSLIGILFTLSLFLYDLGMINALFRWYYQYSPDEALARKKVINTALIFLLAIASLFTVFLFYVAPFLSKILFGRTEFTTLIRLMLLGVLLQSSTWVPLSLLRIKERVLKFTVIIISGMVIMIAANYIFLSAGRGLAGIYEAYIAAYLFMTAGLFFITRREYAVDFSFTELKGMLKFGLPYVLVLFFSWAIDFSDRYLLSRLSSFQQVGLYSVGYRIGQAMYLVIKTFSIAWFPMMLSLSKEYGDRAQKMFGKIFTYFLVAILFIFLGLSVLSKEIVQIFTAQAYYDAAGVIPWIAFSYVLNGVYVFMLCSLIIARNIIIQPVILFISAAANIALNIFLIPKFGMMGSAYATVCSYFIVAVFTTIFAQRLYPINIEWIRLLKAALCSIAIAFVGTMVNAPGIVFGVILKVALISMFFIALYFIGFYSPEEIKKVRSVLALRGILKGA